MNARVEWAIAGGALALALAAVYSNAFTNSFHYDDFHSLVDNPHVRSWSNWSAFFRDPTTFSSMPERAMYRPMVLLSYAFNYHWGGYSTWGYHLVNTVVHLFNALAVYALVYVLGKGSRPALWAALLFALHPLCSEPVNYISSRSESLCALFYMASLLAYIQWRRNGRGWVLVSLVAFAAALLAKSVAAVLPAALLLYEIGFYKKLDARRAGFIVGAYGGVLVLYIWAARRWLGDSLSEPVREYGIQWLTQIKALVYYAYLAVVPVHLSVEPAFIEANGVGDGAVILALLLLLCSAYQLLRRFSLAVPFAGWILLPLLPSSLVPLNVLVNEHRMYLPIAFLCAGSAWFFSRHPLGRNGRTWALVALLVFGGLVRQRNTAWLDELSLWSDAAEKAPFAYRAQMHLGHALEQRGHWGEALQHFARAVECAPEVAETHYNLANALRFAGRLPEARAAYARSLSAEPRFVPALVNWASLLQDIEAYEEAEALLRRAVENEIGEGADLWRRLGVLYVRQQRFAEAEQSYEQSIELDPARAETHYNLGNLYFDTGRAKAAADAYGRALLHERDHRGALRNLGEHLLKVGQFEQAAQLYAQGLRLLPDEVIFYYGLARAQEAGGQATLALSNYRRFVQYGRLNPDHRAAIEQHIKGIERSLRGE
ncbi:MAG: tetratricopeptide (TPR) repeat protein [Planctomycetota bacterium]|jgi:tetratricopeptide (TPR) repeat protein